MKAPIAVALDAPDLQTAKSWAKEVSPYVSTLKIGLENYLRDGKSSIEGGLSITRKASGIDFLTCRAPCKSISKTTI